MMRAPLQGLAGLIPIEPPAAAAAVRTADPMWSISVVSHDHVAQIRRLLEDFDRHLPRECFEILLTVNVAENTAGLEKVWGGRLLVIRNERPRGFSANHNAALRCARGRYIAVVDPELRLIGNPFPALEARIEDAGDAIVSPAVTNGMGRTQDNARDLVTPLALFRRYLLRRRHVPVPGCDHATHVDWVAGLFMAMRRETFRQLGGFDERYYLYCEDTELSIRAWNRGLGVYLVPSRDVVHDAQRKTLKDPKHFFWHCRSLLVLWTSPAFWRFLAKRRPREETPDPAAADEWSVFNK